jgi:O-antigen/teichoic acid export membrane protein
MNTSLGQILRGMIHLGFGEFLGRVFSVSVVILLAHRYGVVVVGIYSLGMTVACYLQPVIDFGLRHVGARLMAQYPQAAGQIMYRVQRRRLLMAGLAVPLTLIYAWLAKLPPDMKVWLALFSATGALYALSLEWAAWGREHLRLVGLSRGFVPFCILVAAVAGHLSGKPVLWWALAGNATGFLLQAIVFRTWWNRYRPSDREAIESLKEVGESLAWRRTSVMGIAWFSNMAFNSIDLLMLGVMSNAQQVGLYSAAYRLLSQVLVTYYLFTNSIYPKLARQTIEDRVRMLRPGFLLPLFGTGVVFAIGLAMARRGLLTIFFGHQFLAAAALLFVLTWCLPLDFLTSYLSNAYIAWGMEKRVLLCTAVAAGSNIALNLIWIPVYGAKAAAVNTLISYVVFLGGLALAGRSAKELAVQKQPGVSTLNYNCDV